MPKSQKKKFSLLKNINVFFIILLAFLPLALAGFATWMRNNGLVMDSYSGYLYGYWAFVIGLPILFFLVFGKLLPAKTVKRIKAYVNYGFLLLYYGVTAVYMWYLNDYWFGLEGHADFPGPSAETFLGAFGLFIVFVIVSFFENYSPGGSSEKKG